MEASTGPIDQECVEAYLFVRSPLRLLIVRRPPERGRIWVPISGKVDAQDADYPSAIRREIREETGFETLLRLFSLDWEVEFEGPKGGRWRLHAFGAELSSGGPPTLSPEHDAFEWVEPPEATARLHYPDNQGAVRRLLEVLSADTPGSPNL
ncbi:MAG: NUDIX domain-containing protein [Thermoplasmata archaeon]